MEATHLDSFAGPALQPNSGGLDAPGATASVSQAGHLRIGETPWITRAVALVAIAIFTFSGSQIVPAVLNSTSIDSASRAGFLLNIALILFAWRRSAQLKLTSVQRDVAEIRAHTLAYFDEVTGLHNRRHLREMITNLCSTGTFPSALILIDLDNFKKINDLYGHAAGDRVLVATAERLKANCPPEASCVRLGGDEFAILLQGAAAEEEKPQQLAQELVKELNRPIRIDQVVAAVGVSIGISILEEPCTDREWLLRRADIAMYEAKALGRNRCVGFDPTMEAKLEERRAREAELRQGIENGEFRPHFQPIVDLATGAIKGFEVLARWNHPTKGLVEPPDFIELAETTGTISDLSFRVMQEALTLARDWPSEYKISVNISPVQFNDPFLAARVLQVISMTGFPPERLEVEIKEQSLLQNHEIAISVLTSLKNCGITIAVDDFGVSYASFTRLRLLPFDRIKLDRSYMAELMDDEQCNALVNAVSALGRGLKIPITAEGVETESIQAKLSELGCGDAQGWLFGKALTAQEVALGYLDKPAPVDLIAAPQEADVTIERGRSAA